MIWSFIHFAFVSMAVTYILAESVIGRIWRYPVAQLAKKLGPFLNHYLLTLIYCPACTGFWVGLTLYSLGWCSWTEGAPRPDTLAGCCGLILGMLLLRLTPFSAAATEIEDVEEQNNESTQAREESPGE